jgi:hypothetical protein
LVIVRGVGVVVVVVVVSGPGSGVEVGEGREERLVVLRASFSSSEEEECSVLVRLRFPRGPRGAGGCLGFLGLASEVRALAAVVLMGVGFEEAVRPAVTFLMALMPAVLEVDLAGVGLGAGSTEGEGRTGGAAGICIVIWVDVFMPMTKRLLTSS